MRIPFFQHLILACFVCLVLGMFSVSGARVLSPEESTLFLSNIIEKTMQENFWGIWRVRNFTKNTDRFYEVAFLQNHGFGWTNMSNESQMVVGIQDYRFVYNLEENTVDGVFPGFEIPFLPILEDNLTLFRENYLLEYQENQAFIVSRKTGETVRSFTLDFRGAFSGQVYYGSEGEALQEGRFIYRDYSPDYEQIAFFVDAMERCLEELDRISNDDHREEKILEPQSLPPGYQLARVFMIRGKDGKAFQSLYSDGMNYFSIFQSVYPRVSSSSRLGRTSLVRKDDNLTILVGERGGFMITLVGNLEPEEVSEIFSSMNLEGGT